MVGKLSYKQLFTFGSIGFGFITLFTIIGCIVYYSNRGFEMSDEAYYLMNSNYYNHSAYNVSAFGLLNHLACFGDATLIHLRLAKLIYQIIAILFFIWCLLKYLNFKGINLDIKQKAFAVILLSVTSFGHYDYLPMTLSYNSWSLILMLICFAIILLEFTIASVGINLITSVVVGMLCFGLIVAKLPNGIIAAGLYGIFNLFYIKKNTILKVGGFIMGLFVGYLIILKTPENLCALIENYRITLFDVKHAESGTYLKQMYKLIAICGQHKMKTSIVLGIVLIVVFVGKKLMAYIKNIMSPKKQAYSYLIFSFGFMLCLPFCKGNGHKSYNDFIAVGLLIVNPLLFIYLYRPTSSKWVSFFKNDIYMVITVLLLTPVFLMLGTNNAFYYSVSPTMVFAFAGILVLIINSKINYTVYVSLFSLVSCLFILSILYFGGIKKPYKQSSLMDKNYPLSFNPLIKGVYESRDAFIDYTSVNYLITHFNKEHQPFLTFFNFYGFAVINNNQTIPEMPLSSQDRMLEFNDYVLSRSTINQHKPLLLLPDTIIANPKFNSLFNKYHISLNQNYKLVYQYHFLGNKEKICFYKSTL